MKCILRNKSEMNDDQEMNSVDDYITEGNAILNRMKKAILNKKGIRLSAYEMQFIATMQIGAIILDEDTQHNIEF